MSLIKEKIVINLKKKLDPEAGYIWELPAFYVYYKTITYSLTPHATLEVKTLP